jgi:hypothetical protein
MLTTVMKLHLPFTITLLSPVSALGKTSTCNDTLPTHSASLDEWSRKLTEISQQNNSVRYEMVNHEICHTKIQQNIFCLLG